MKKFNKKIIGLAIFGLAIIVACICLAIPTNHIEFRLTLSPDELDGKKYETISIKGDDAHIWKYPYLTERDIKKVRMIRSFSSPDMLLLSLEFNEDGKKKLYRFTKKFADRKAAIFADGKLITCVKIGVPIFTSDVVVVVWPWTEKELKSFIKKVNREAEDRLTRYIEQQEKLNEMIHQRLTEVLSQINTKVEHSNSDVKERSDGFDGIESEARYDNSI